MSDELIRELERVAMSMRTPTAVERWAIGYARLGDPEPLKLFRMIRRVIVTSERQSRIGQIEETFRSTSAGGAVGGRLQELNGRVIARLATELRALGRLWRRFMEQRRGDIEYGSPIMALIHTDVRSRYAIDAGRAELGTDARRRGEVRVHRRRVGLVRPRPISPETARLIGNGLRRFQGRCGHASGVMVCLHLPDHDGPHDWQCWAQIEPGVYCEQERDHAAGLRDSLHTADGRTWATVSARPLERD